MKHSEHAPVSILIIDKNALITFVNLKMVSFSGYTKEELIGTHLWDYCALSSCKETLQVYLDELSSSKVKKNTIVFTRLKKKNNEIYDAQLDIGIEPDNGFFVLITDISVYNQEHEKLESIIRDRTDKLLRANKILKLSNELSSLILSDSLVDIGSCLSLVREELELTDSFVCYKNGSIDLYKTIHVNEFNEVKEDQVPALDCCVSCLKDCKKPYKGTSGELCTFKPSICVVKKYIENSINITIVPIEIFSNIWGVMGVGRKNCGKWSDLEVEALASLGRLIAIMITNKESQDVLIQHIKTKFSKINQMREQRKLTCEVQNGCK